MSYIYYINIITASKYNRERNKRENANLLE